MITEFEKSQIRLKCAEIAINFGSRNNFSEDIWKVKANDIYKFALETTVKTASRAKKK